MKPQKHDGRSAGLSGVMKVVRVFESLWQRLPQRYWLYLAAKTAVVVVAFRALWVLMERVIPEPHEIASYKLGRFGQDLPWTSAIFVYFLLLAGASYLVVWDQRYRCRTCLRRLRMPVATGSWDQMLRIGKPGMEYICPFGHGTLNVHQIRFTGRERDDWKEHGEDIWKELESLSGSEK